mgnify:CR=1 FL=1
MEGKGVGARFEHHAVVGPELLGEGSDCRWFGGETPSLAGFRTRLENRCLGTVFAEVQTNHASHGGVPFRRSLGGHDNYPSELTAQPGKSKGRPLRLTGSKPIARTACPHRVIARTTVRPTPAARSLCETPANVVHMFHTA